MARQVRGQLIALKEQEFSMAALVIGASDARILFRHLLINAIGPIIVQITFLVPNAIFTEAFLSFIGIGISAPMASWGSMAQDARQVLTMHPGQLLLPPESVLSLPDYKPHHIQPIPDGMQINLLPHSGHPSVSYQRSSHLQKCHWM